MIVCAISGCALKAHALKLCKRHYECWRRFMASYRPRAKLTAEQVKHIRTSGLSTKILAADLGRHYTMISKIRSGQFYRDSQISGK